MALLNLGILAHVDAGKTSLTERLLHDAGVIDEIGSVDAGSTQTDTLALERQRGITIKSAVVSFAIGGVTVNLIDTPGHPDFIAEVERVLGVLDGAVLVVSAVEGVQAQTRVLMRTLRRLRLPTLLFVNKIDRGGADPDRVVEAIAAKLTPAVVPMTAVRGAGTRAAAAVPDPELPARLLSQLSTVDDSAARRVRRERVRPERTAAACLAEQTRRARVHPVFFGSAITGAGVAELTEGIATLLPSTGGDPEARCPAPCSRSSAARPARRSRTRGCSPAPCASATGWPASRRSPGSACSSAAASSPGRPSTRDRSASSGGCARCGSATRSASRGPDRPSTSRRRRWRPSSSRRPAGAAPCTPRSPSSPSRTR